MKKIVYISSFDPITNDELNYFKSHKDNDFVLLITPNGKESLDNRILMVNLVMFGMNFALHEIEVEKVNLVDLFNSFEDASLLVKEDKFYLISKNTIIKNKMVFNLKYYKNLDAEKVYNLENLDIPKTAIDFIVKTNLYFMNKISPHYKEKRLKHAISVAETAYKIAVENKLEHKDYYYIAGLLHDIAKKIDKDDITIEYMEKYYRKHLNEPKWSYHQFIGGLLTKMLFPNVNDDIIDAIECHTTGKANMSTLAKILYASDKIEPLRGYDSSGFIKSMERDYNSGFIEVLSANREFNESDEEDDISELVKETNKYYL